MVGCKRKTYICKNKWQILGEKPMLHQDINIINTALADKE